MKFFQQVTQTGQQQGPGGLGTVAGVNVSTPSLSERVSQQHQHCRPVQPADKQGIPGLLSVGSQGHMSGQDMQSKPSPTGEDKQQSLPPAFSSPKLQDKVPQNIVSKPKSYGLPPPQQRQVLKTGQQQQSPPFLTGKRDQKSSPRAPDLPQHLGQAVVPMAPPYIPQQSASTSSQSAENSPMENGSQLDVALSNSILIGNLEPLVSNEHMNTKTNVEKVAHI